MEAIYERNPEIQPQQISITKPYNKKACFSCNSVDHQYFECIPCKITYCYDCYDKIIKGNKCIKCKKKLTNCNGIFMPITPMVSKEEKCYNCEKRGINICSECKSIKMCLDHSNGFSYIITMSVIIFITKHFRFLKNIENLILQITTVKISNQSLLLQVIQYIFWGLMALFFVLIPIVFFSFSPVLFPIIALANLISLVLVYPMYYLCGKKYICNICIRPEDV